MITVKTSDDGKKLLFCEGEVEIHEIPIEDPADAIHGLACLQDHRWLTHEITKKALVLAAVAALAYQHNVARNIP